MLTHSEEPEENLCLCFVWLIEHCAVGSSLLLVKAMNDLLDLAMFAAHLLLSDKHSGLLWVPQDASVMFRAFSERWIFSETGF